MFFPEKLFWDTERRKYVEHKASDFLYMIKKREHFLNRASDCMRYVLAHTDRCIWTRPVNNDTNFGVTVSVVLRENRIQKKNARVLYNVI